MAGIFTRFTLRSLAQNRVRTAVTVVGTRCPRRFWPPC